MYRIFALAQPHLVFLPVMSDTISRPFFPTLELSMPEILVAGLPTLAEAAYKISSCQACNPDANIEFGMIINFVKDLSPKETLFCQTEPVSCPNCAAEIWEATLVSFF